MSLAFPLTLAVGGLGGFLFYLLNLPLPWLLGAMLATTLASVAGGTMQVPGLMRNAMLIVLGAMLGSRFQPDLLGQVEQWVWTIGFLPIYVAVIALTMMWYLRRVAGMDARTAYFACAPGGLGEMVILADRYGADVPRVSLVHAERVLLLVTVIPFIAQAGGLGFAEMVVEAGDQKSTTAIDAALALLCGVAGYGLAWLARMPSAALLGPMFANAVLHVTGHVTGEPPDLLVIIAQVVIGAAVGARFSGPSLREILFTLAHGVVLTVLMVAMSTVFALLIHPLSGLPFTNVVLAYVPGGIAEMALVALSLGIDPALVTTHHMIRIFLVVALAPLAFQWLAGKAAGASVVSPGDLR